MYRWRVEQTAVVPIRRPVGPPLSDRERAVLLFEGSWRGGGLRKRDAIKERFGIGATTYAAVLASVLANPEAEALYPHLVDRLRRSRRPSGAARSGVAHAS